MGTPQEWIRRNIGLLEGRLRTLSGALRAFSEATTNCEVLLDVVARTLAEVVKDGLESRDQRA